MDKSTFYMQLGKQLDALLMDESDTIANLANTGALLNMHLCDINWVGFYILKQKELVLGPFQGKVACMHIPLGKGVCGTCASSGQIQRIANVHEFSGHIACDAMSNSEIVLPIYKDKNLYGVLDIDSTVFDRFDAEDEVGLSLIVKILEQHL